jgi:hypothetical protein
MGDQSLGVRPRKFEGRVTEYGDMPLPSATLGLSKAKEILGTEGLLFKSRRMPLSAVFADEPLLSLPAHEKLYGEDENDEWRPRGPSTKFDIDGTREEVEVEVGAGDLM